MKNRLIRYAVLLAVLSLCAVLCAGCSSPSVKGYTNRYDTEENLALFRESSLFPLAEGFYNSSKKYPAAAYGEDEMSDPYFFTRTRNPTTPPEPFLAVSVRLDSDRQPVWNVCGGSAESMDLSNVRTLVLCIVSESSATYTENGYGKAGSFRGTSESARILYLDVKKGTYIQENKLAGKKLPEHTTSVPHYKLSNSDLVSQIRKDLTLPYTLSPDGEITGGKLGEEYNGYLFPDSVKKITKLEISPEITSLCLPASVGEISPGVIPRQTKTVKYADPRAVVLTVLPGTQGEDFARENGYVYRRPEHEAKYLWVAGCECTFDYNSLYARYFPATPDGDLAELMKNGYMLFVEPGSPAEKYAREHQYIYSYTSNREKRCCIDGLEWVFYDKSGRGQVLCVPDGVKLTDELLAWMKKQTSRVLTAPGSSAEEALREAGLECWTGDDAAAERTWTDEGGLNWRIAYSFRDACVLAVHIPQDYMQERKELDIWQLLKDIGYSSGNSYPEIYPLCYVLPGSWAAENAGVRIEEGSTVLHMSKSGYDYNGRYISEYACGVVTEVIDPYFNAFDYGEPQKMITDHGVKALYSVSPLGNNPVEPFALTGDPGKLYYWTPDSQDSHIRNGKVLEDAHTLKIAGDMTDGEELSWVLYRAGQEAPFLLQIEEGTAVETYARENGIPFEIWSLQETPFIE